ncbi:hypothetical protein [Pseudonocardia alni]|uniref:hypothetical protein n=1 Tax=Pseudonocardia alni TaxID=33907 RepID=UPI0033EB64AA
MTSNHHDGDGGADDVEFDADDPDDYGHVPFPARRGRRGIGGTGGQVTARFADGSQWLAYTGPGEQGPVERSGSHGGVRPAGHRGLPATDRARLIL